MKKILKDKNWLYTFGSMAASFALIVTMLNVNTTCALHAHQDELPKSANKLRKF